MRWVALTTAAMLLLASCSNSQGGSGSTSLSAPAGQGSPSAAGQSSATATGQSPSAAPRNLKPQLLAVSELPEGWAVDNSAAETGGSVPPCVMTLQAKMHTADRAEADFVKGTDVPQFQQSIGYYGSSAAALSTFRAATNVLDNCTDFSFTSDGHKYTGSIGQLSFPQLGDDTEAWQLVLSSEGVTVGLNEVLVHKGSELTSLLYGDLGTPDLTEVEALAREAVAKMPAT